MFETIALVLIYILTPVFLIYLSERFIIIEKIGAVLIAYALGLLIGNLGVIQQMSNFAEVQQVLNSLTIPLAIPLLLFSLNIRSWLKVAGKAVVALFVLLFSVVFSVALGYFLFNDGIDEPWMVSGMLMGVYSGGTPNLAAIHSMLGASPELFITINTLDIFVSALYLLFLMTAGKYLFRRFLPAYKENGNITEIDNYQEENYYKGIFNKPNILPLLKAIGIAVLISAASIGVSFVITGEISMLVLILSITTLAIGASLIKHINRIKYTFQTGMYFIVIFCMVVASMADISELGGIALNILKYISFVVFGSLIVKFILSKVFKIDADTLIVASTALICSPPFVPVMAGVLKNKQILVTGLTIGIIGYAVGNYLGVTIAYILRMF